MNSRLHKSSFLCNGGGQMAEPARVTVIPVKENQLHGRPGGGGGGVSLSLEGATPVNWRSQDDRVTTNSSSLIQNQGNGKTSINVGGAGSGGDLPKSAKYRQKTALQAERTQLVSPETKATKLAMVVNVTSSGRGSPSPCAVLPVPVQLPCSVNGSCTTSGVGPGQMVPSPGPSITSLSVNSSTSPSSHPSQSASMAQPAQPVDLCCYCRTNPATLTLASAIQMSAQKYCSSCYSLVQQLKKEEEMECAPPPSRRSAIPVQNPEGPPTTVIKVMDEQRSSAGSPGLFATQAAPPVQRCCEPASTSLALPGDDNFRGSVHVEGIRIPPSQKPTKAGKRSEDVVEPEFVPKENSPSVLRRQTQYQACSKFDLRTDRPVEEQRRERSNDCCQLNEVQHHQEQQLEADIAAEEIYRPLPFNPGFVESAPSSNDFIPPSVSAPPYAGDVASEKQPIPFDAPVLPQAPPVLPQAPPPQYLYPPGAPPRYEEVASSIPVSLDQAGYFGHQSKAASAGGASIRTIHAFGRYGELATQPGAFRSPTRVNASRGGIVVVSDSAHKTVQAFSPTGECLALIRVSSDVNGCSCYDKNKLAVGSSSGVQVYDFNGVLKKSIPLGPVVNTVSFPGAGFIAVHPKALSIFRGPNETLVRTLKDRSNPGPVRQPVPFDNITDAAVNSQKDVVVLDAGAASGLGSIFILSEDGYLKSTIVPGREPCGVLRQPMAVAVDHGHNVLVSDSGNKRILLFGANGRFQRQLVGPPPPSSPAAPLSGPGAIAWPIGLDVADDGRLFVVVKAEKFAEIRVLTYN